MNEQELCELLQGEILSGARAAGEALPSERDLAAEHGMAKTAVHAALMGLASQGLVDVFPRQGAFVADFRREGNWNTLELLLTGDADWEDVKGFAEIRLAMDELAIRLFTARQTLADVLDLQAVIEEARVAAMRASDPEGLSEALFEFFALIYDRSGNTLLPLVHRAMASASDTFWTGFIRQCGGRRVVSLLQDCVEGIRRGDDGAAMRALRAGVRVYVEL